MPSVLIVDDLSAIHEMLAAVIEPTGYETFFASDGEEALEKYKADPKDVVLADISMQPMDGISLLQNLKAFDPDSVVILMTGYASTETAMKALKFGAFDYIQKPFKIAELLQALKRAVEVPKSRGGFGEPALSSAGAQKLASRFPGESRQIQQLRQQAANLMAGRAPLLLSGERGTGKRTLAELIHEGGETEGPMIVVDCEQLDESELIAGLGREGATGDDWIARAKGGTILLQNVNELSLETQRLLVGVLKRAADIRIVCTTKIDLEALVDEGRFDDELFYRIATLPISLPPLREHLEDLPELVNHFIRQARNALFEPAQIEFDPDALRMMRGYGWPGNVAELAQAVTSLASTTETRVITADQLPQRLSSVDGWPSLDEHLAREKTAYIRRVLHACGDDKEKAARILGCRIDDV